MRKLQVSAEADAKKVADQVLSDISSLMMLSEDVAVANDAARQDLKVEKPLQSLLDLRGQFHPDEDGKSELGAVIRTLKKAVNAIINKFGGDTPVAFAKEDDVMRSHIKTYIYDVVGELEMKQTTADVLCEDLNTREGALTDEIRRQSFELNKPLCRKRGKLEEARIEALQELVAFYIGRVSGNTLHGESIELLARKQEEGKACLRTEHANNEAMLLFHNKLAEELKGQWQELEDFVGTAELEYQQEKKQNNLITMALKSLQQHHIRRVQDSLQALLATSEGLKEAGVALEEKRLAYEEAKRLADERRPKLREAADTHEDALDRLRGADDLLNDFGECMNGAYVGLKAKAERDVQRLADNVPLYGVRCMEVKEALLEDVNAMMAKLEELMQESLKDRTQLVSELRRLQYADDDDCFPEKEKELEKCEKELLAFNQQREKLSAVLQKWDGEGMRIAEEAAEKADGSLRAETLEWLNEFHFGGAQRPALFALQEDHPVSGPLFLQLKNCADTAEDDTSSVLSSSNWGLIDDTGMASVDASGAQ